MITYEESLELFCAFLLLVFAVIVLEFKKGHDLLLFLGLIIAILGFLVYLARCSYFRRRMRILHAFYCAVVIITSSIEYHDSASEAKPGGKRILPRFTGLVVSVIIFVLLFGEIIHEDRKRRLITAANADSESDIEMQQPLLNEDNNDADDTELQRRGDDNTADRELQGRKMKNLKSDGKSESQLPVQVNHSKVTVAKTDVFLYLYRVSIKCEDGSPVDVKDIGTRILDKVRDAVEHKLFAYDGENSLLIVGPLPEYMLGFNVPLDEVSSNRNPGNGSPGVGGSSDDTGRKRMRRKPRSKIYIVALRCAAKIPMQAIVPRWQDSEHFQEAVVVRDIILRQSAAQQGSLLLRQSFLFNDDRNFADLGGGVFGCLGFLRATRGSLSLNMDVSTIMIVRPGPVNDFLLFKQKVDHPGRFDGIKAIPE